jgi:hypothetical protein
MPQITQPGSLTGQTATITAGTTITGNLSFASYGYAALAAFTPITLGNAGLITATGSSPNAIDAGILLTAGGTISNSGTIIGPSGVYLAAGSLTNSGTIISTAITRGTFNIGGIVNNNATGQLAIANSGLVAGAYLGIALTGPTAITNTGTIRASLGASQGILLQAGGSIANTGLISGVYLGIYLGKNTADAIINSGSILATSTLTQFHPRAGTAIGLYSTIANSLTNAAPGLISGAETAIRTGNAATTILNAGTIAGGTTAIAFAPGYANRLIIEPGATFTGLVDGAGATTLEFSGTAQGTISNFNASFKNITTIVIDPESSWTFQNITLAPHEIITTTGNISIQLDGTIETIIATPLACFCAGTHILTPNGETPIEHLAPGDIVITLGGLDVPIKWIGRRSLTRPPAAAQPIRIQAGAIANNIPARDLYLSPDHALYFENHLIPAKALLNHRNITRAEKPKLTYFHIELASHSIIFAENTACETYLETGNRSCFENAPITTLHPEFSSEKFQSIREAKSCYPLTESGPILDHLRTNILLRAFNRTHPQPSLRGA